MRIVKPLLLALIAACWVLGQDPQGTIRVDATLVEIDVGVFDTDGRPRVSLSRDDFVLFEDGVEQEIVAFSPVETPFSMLLLLDRSGSTKDDTPLLLSAINAFVSELRSQDRFKIVGFDEDVQTLAPWRTRGLALPSFPPPVAGGLTDLYGALNDAAKQLGGMTGRRGAIVLTDGAHTGWCPKGMCLREEELDGEIPTRPVTLDGRPVRRLVDSLDDRSFQSTLRAIRGSGAPFYVVAVDTDLNPWGYFSPTDLYDKQQLRARLAQLADISGGNIAFPRRREALAALYSGIARDLGTSYSLGWHPSGRTGRTGAYRKVEVRTRSGFFTVKQSRQGYYVQ